MCVCVCDPSVKLPNAIQQKHSVRGSAVASAVFASLGYSSASSCSQSCRERV